MILIKAFNIDWDTDGEKIDWLPNEVFFHVDNDFNPEEDLCDLLTDEYNYLVNVAEYEIMAKTKEKSVLVPEIV